MPVDYMSVRSSGRIINTLPLYAIDIGALTSSVKSLFCSSVSDRSPKPPCHPCHHRNWSHFWLFPLDAHHLFMHPGMTSTFGQVQGKFESASFEKSYSQLNAEHLVYTHPFSHLAHNYQHKWNPRKSDLPFRLNVRRNLIALGEARRAVPTSNNLPLPAIHGNGSKADRSSFLVSTLSRLT